MADVQTDGTQEAEQAKGLDAIIDGAIEQHGLDDTPKQEIVDEQPDKAASKLDETGRAHGADGKFIPKDKADATASKDGQAEAAVKTPATEAVTAPVVQQVALPDAWSPEWKAKAATLPPEQQTLLVEQYKAMQGDYTKGKQQIAEERRSYEPVLSEVNKWNPYFQQLGAAPHQLIGGLIQTEYGLRTGTPEQKRQIVQGILRDYGISLDQPAADGSQPDPANSQLHQEVNGLRQQVRSFFEQQNQTENQRLQAEITTFSQSKDAQGNLTYPHFERVKQTMGQLMGAGQAPDLKSAYDKAVRLDDELFGQTLESERKRVAEADEKARVEAVEKAKKAQPIRSSDGSPKGGQQLKGLDAHLSAALAKAGVAD